MKPWQALLTSNATALVALSFACTICAVEGLYRVVTRGASINNRIDRLWQKLGAFHGSHAPLVQPCLEGSISVGDTRFSWIPETRSSSPVERHAEAIWRINLLQHFPCCDSCVRQVSTRADNAGMTLGIHVHVASPGSVAVDRALNQERGRAEGLLSRLNGPVQNGHKNCLVPNRRQRHHVHHSKF